LNIIAVLIGQIIKQRRIYILELLEQIENKCDYRLVPMLLRHLVDVGENDGQHTLHILLNQTHHRVAVEEQHAPLGHLEVRRAQAARDLPEHALHAAPVVLRLDHVQDLLQLIDEHDLLKYRVIKHSNK